MMKKQYWQSLEEYHQDPEFLEAQKGEFAEDHLEGGLKLATTRRDFLKIMGLGFTAGAVACNPAPVHKAIPYLNKPEEVTPGLANWYATTCGACSASCGLLVKVRDGRPIKIEGNDEDPLTLGGTCAVGQASVLSLYDSKRLRGPYKNGQLSDWQTVDGDIKGKLEALKGQKTPIVILSSTIPSPSALALIKEFTDAFPGSRHVAYDAASGSAIRAANKEIFGNAFVPGYRFDQAQAIVSLDADFLGTWISPVEFTRQYVKNRKLDDKMALSTHIQIESGLSITGANADNRIPASPSEQAAIALWMWQELMPKANPGVRLKSLVSTPPVDPALLQKTVDLLWANRGKALVVSGSNDVALQVVVGRINELLGSYGKTIDIAHPSWQKQGDDAAMAQLVDDMGAGKVGALLVVGANPAYDYLAGTRVAEALKTVPLVVSFAGTMDETAALAHYVCPTHYFLEAWGDALPRVGVHTLQQPTIAPLFDTRAATESLLRWMGRNDTAYAYLQNYWKTNVLNGESNFQAAWDKALQSGVYTSTKQENGIAPNLSGDAFDKASQALLATYTAGQSARKAGKFELSLYQKVGIQDGTWAGNPWLQELPDPVTKVAWANYVSIAPATAAHVGVKQGDVVAVAGDDKTSIELPILIQPGQAAGTLSIALGYGRYCGNKVYGANAYPLSRYINNAIAFDRAGVSLQSTGKTYALAFAQTHHSAEGRPLVLETTLDEYKRNPKIGGEHHELVSLWNKHEPSENSWGMSIDLNSCTGCSACVVACQAENNVPVVGEEESRLNRNMYWLRLDRYYSDSPEAPGTVFQPMLCQHCGNAPCETVCPVLATTHSSDGLSQQVYNRCVGTRYCANNCPYKVRRFNWFDYPHEDPLANMVLNPDVVVRSRGVMEKCSMCVQRIQASKAMVKREGRTLKDGDIETACQQACPADAIVFGDFLDPSSRLNKAVKESRNYRVLEELGIRPVVSYLAKVRNPIA